ncbi:hypothetical protein [Lacticaseibacillus rhamnosus]|uniref:hypothetical protein n=1 Tax=Lacticaseibacillus rhamnosus TaxID=47715 RepID=UPI001CDC433B|nr:hypothetical protein [Lacticaseibacillus rhamnosus]
MSASHLLLTLALALQNSLAKKGQPLDFLIHVTGLLLFPGKEKATWMNSSMWRLIASEILTAIMDTNLIGLYP